MSPELLPCEVTVCGERVLHLAVSLSGDVVLPNEWHGTIGYNEMG